MEERGHCDVHQLVRGPDGLCVLCRRNLASDPFSEVAASPAASTRVGLIVTLCSLGLMAAIGASIWVTPTDEPHEVVVTDPAPPTFSDRLVATTATTTAAPAATAHDSDEARRQELARIAKSNIWQRPPEAPAPTTDEAPPTLEVVPGPPAPSAPPSAAALEAQHRRQIEEAQRDHARHAAVAAQIEQRAKDHQRSLQDAALAEARGKVRVEVYTAAWCGNCRRAIAYLQQQSGLRYAVHDIDVDPRAREKMRKLNPEHSIPTFEIDDTVIVGFSQRSFEQALDAAARTRARLRP